MISPDMDFLARKINELESQHKGTRAAQLPQSSIVTPAGDDLLIGEAAENAQDALAETDLLGEDLTEVGDNVDSEAENFTAVPDWVGDAGIVGDVAWEMAQEVSDRVDETQAAADQIASDLLVVSQESAQAAADALEAKNKADSAVVSTIPEYATSGSPETEPTTGWTTVRPEWVEGTWIWSRTTTVYGNGDTSVSDPVPLTGPAGAPGQPGDAGKGISSTEVRYQASSSGIIEPTGTWLTDIPVVPAGHFLWTRTVITYTDSTTSTAFSVSKVGEDGQPGQPGDPGAPGSDGVSITTLTRFYWLGTSQPAVPTASPPPAPWMTTEPTYTAGSSANLYEVTRTIKSDGTWSYGPVSLSASFTAAKQAYTLANDTKFLAEGLYQTIPSVTAPTTSPTGALKQGDQWWKIGAAGTPEEGKFIGVAVWNGSTWQDRQMVADSLLVPGSVGAVLIGDGAITAPKLSVDALDFKTGRGMNIFGSVIEGGTFRLSDSGGFGQTFYHDCESLLGWETIPNSGQTLSTFTNQGTRSVRLENWFETYIGFGHPYPVFNYDSYIEISVWSSKPKFIIDFASNSPEIVGFDVEVTPNTWHNLTIPAPGSGEIWDMALLPYDYNDTGVLYISQIAIYSPFEFESGVTIGRNGWGDAQIVSTTDASRTTISGGKVHLDQPQHPGTGSTTLGHAGITHESSNSRFSIYVPNSSPGLGIDLIAGSDVPSGLAEVSLSPNFNGNFNSKISLNSDYIDFNGRTSAPGNVFSSVSAMNNWTTAAPGTIAHVTSNGMAYMRLENKWGLMPDLTRDTIGSVSLPGSSGSGFSVLVASYIVSAGIIYISINLTGSIGQGSGVDVWSGINSWMRPTSNKQAAAWLDGGYTGVAWARSNGTIAVANRSGGTRSSVQFTVSYPLT